MRWLANPRGGRRTPRAATGRRSRLRVRTVEILPGEVVLIDQLALPQEERYVHCRTWQEVADAHHRHDGARGAGHRRRGGRRHGARGRQAAAAGADRGGFGPRSRRPPRGWRPRGPRPSTSAGPSTRCGRLAGDEPAAGSRPQALAAALLTRAQADPRRRHRALPAHRRARGRPVQARRHHPHALQRRRPGHRRLRHRARRHPRRASPGTATSACSSTRRARGCRGRVSRPGSCRSRASRTALITDNMAGYFIARRRRRRGRGRRPHRRQRRHGQQDRHLQRRRAGQGARRAVLRGGAAVDGGPPSASGAEIPIEERAEDEVHVVPRAPRGAGRRPRPSPGLRRHAGGQHHRHRHRGRRAAAAVRDALRAAVRAGTCVCGGIAGRPRGSHAVVPGPMIMAAGLGTRLLPLTGLTSKPMVPILNRPVMEHILHLLRRHGVTEVAANLHYQPRRDPRVLRRRLRPSASASALQRSSPSCWARPAAPALSASSSATAPSWWSAATRSPTWTSRRSSPRTAPRRHRHHGRQAGRRPVALRRGRARRRGRVTGFQEKPARRRGALRPLQLRHLRLRAARSSTTSPPAPFVDCALRRLPGLAGRRVPVHVLAARARTGTTSATSSSTGAATSTPCSAASSSTCRAREITPRRVGGRGHAGRARRAHRAAGAHRRRLPRGGRAPSSSARSSSATAA